MMKSFINLFIYPFRSSLGWNNNPTCLQFQNSFKRFLVRQDIKGGAGNCLPMDSTFCLGASREEVHKFNQCGTNKKDIEDKLLEIDDRLISMIKLSDYKVKVIRYISGCVIKMTQRQWKCGDCLQALICSQEEAAENPAFALLNRKRWGRLIDSSNDVIRICLETEKHIVQKIGERATAPSRDAIPKIAAHVLSVCLHGTN